MPIASFISLSRRCESQALTHFPSVNSFIWKKTQFEWLRIPRRINQKHNRIGMGGGERQRLFDGKTERSIFEAENDLIAVFIAVAISIGCCIRDSRLRVPFFFVSLPRSPIFFISLPPLLCACLLSGRCRRVINLENYKLIRN